MDYLTWFIVGIVLYGLYLMYKSKKSSFGFGETVYVATMQGCTYCKPIIEMKNKGAFKSQPNIVSLDAKKDENGKIKELKIDTFPTIITESGKVYDGPREAQKIIEFARANK
jgi:hypothetical protein